MEPIVRRASGANIAEDVKLKVSERFYPPVRDMVEGVDEPNTMSLGEDGKLNLSDNEGKVDKVITRKELDNDISTIKGDIEVVYQDIATEVQTINTVISTEVQNLNTTIDTKVQTVNSNIETLSASVNQVNNTPDLLKPVSVPQQAAINAVIAGVQSIIPTDNPLTNVSIYKASTEGLYSKFGNIPVTPEDILAGDVQILRSTTGTFSKKIIPVVGLAAYTTKNEIDTTLNGTFAKVSATLAVGTQILPTALEVTATILAGEAFRYAISVADGIVDRVQLFVTYEGDSARTQLAAPTQNINGNHDFVAAKKIKAITVYVSVVNVIGNGDITVNYRKITELPSYKIELLKTDLSTVKQDQGLVKTDVSTLKQGQTTITGEIADVRGELNGKLLGEKTTPVVVGTNVDPGSQEIALSIKKGELFKYVVSDPTKAFVLIRLYVTYVGDSARTLLYTANANVTGEYQFIAEKDIKAITVYIPSTEVIAIGSLTVQYYKYGALNKEVKFLQKQNLTYNSNPTSANYPVGDNNRIQLKGTATTLKNDKENNILSKVSKPVNYILGLQNIIEEEAKIGDNGIYHTTNKVFNDSNLVVTEYINPSLKKRVSKNSTVVDVIDGIRTRFQLPEYINRETDIDVYVNGLRMQLNTDYKIYPTKKCIIFTVAPLVNSKIILDYEVYVDEFNINLSFSGLTMNDTKTKILGIDAKTIDNNNATYIFEEVGKAVIAYEGTNLTQAYADIVPDPINPAEKALQFHIKEPNALDNTKSRIQLHITGPKASEVINIVDVFIPTTMSHLEQWSEPITWLTLQEIWCDVAGPVQVGKPKFRMSLGMLKKAGVGSKLYFSVKVEDLDYTAEGVPYFTKLYELINETFLFPYGEWFTLTTEVVAGDAQHGRFKLVAKKGASAAITIFDQVCQTQATGYYDLTTKEALYTRTDMLKLYTSAALTNFMKNSGRTLDVYFKNWKFKGLCVARD